MQRVIIFFIAVYVIALIPEFIKLQGVSSGIIDFCQYFSGIVTGVLATFFFRMLLTKTA